jgi:hypothetical protein
VRLGDPALAALAEILDDPEFARPVRVHAPRTVSAFNNAAAMQVLLARLRSEADGLVRYKALRGLEELTQKTSLHIERAPIAREILRNGNEYLRFFAQNFALARYIEPQGREELDLVQALLEDKLYQSRDRLVRLLHVVYRDNDIAGIFRALRAGDRRLRGRAIEYLDVLIRDFGRSSVEVAALLRVVVDDLTPEERARRATELVGEVRDARSALTQLSSDPDSIVHELATRALGALAPSSVTASAPVQAEERA